MQTGSFHHLRMNGHDQHIHMPGMPQQILNKAHSEQAAQEGSAGLADDYLRSLHVIHPLEQMLIEMLAASRLRDVHYPAQPFGQSLQRIQPLLLLRRLHAGTVYVVYMPLRLQAVCNAEAAADQPFSLRSCVYTDEDDLPSAPRSAQGWLPFPSLQPLIHIIGNLAQGQLTQGDQIADFEKDSSA